MSDQIFNTFEEWLDNAIKQKKLKGFVNRCVDLSKKFNLSTDDISLSFLASYIVFNDYMHLKEGMEIISLAKKE